MTDLRTLLHENATPSPDIRASHSLLEDDLARGRSALRRRRSRRGVRTGLVAVASAGAIAFAALGGLPGGGSTTATGPTSPPASATLGPVSLVDFTGTEPVGFTIDKVPSGWEVQSSNADQLLLAPVGLANKDTNNFADKIVVSLGDALPEELPGTDVAVGSATGTIFTMEDYDANDKPIPSLTKTLFVPQPSGSYLSIQIWDASGWTNAQIAEFGAGIHPTGEATVSVG